MDSIRTFAEAHSELGSAFGDCCIVGAALLMILVLFLDAWGKSAMGNNTTPGPKVVPPGGFFKEPRL